jgi:hypothetical protein
MTLPAPSAAIPGTLIGWEKGRAEPAAPSLPKILASWGTTLAAPYS